MKKVLKLVIRGGVLRQQDDDLSEDAAEFVRNQLSAVQLKTRPPRGEPFPPGLPLPRVFGCSV